MTESRVPATFDALVSTLQAAVAADVAVWDGPIVTGDYRNAVYIGYDGAPESEFKASDTDQAWAAIGQRKRNEEIHIVGAVVVLFGGTAPSWKATRDAAFSILQSIGQSLRADPSLGQNSPSYVDTFVAELWPGEYFQEPCPAGNQARIVFTIHVKTRV